MSQFSCLPTVIGGAAADPHHYLAILQKSPIAKRWEGLFAYLILGYAAAFMTKGRDHLDSAIQGARIGFVIYGVFDFTSTFMVIAPSP